MRRVRVKLALGLRSSLCRQSSDSRPLFRQHEGSVGEGRAGGRKQSVRLYDGSRCFRERQWQRAVALTGLLARDGGGRAIPRKNDGKNIRQVKDKTRQIPKRTPHASLKAEPKRFGPSGEPDSVAFGNRPALTSSGPATLPSPLPWKDLLHVDTFPHR